MSEDKNKKQIEIVDGDGTELDISPVYEDINDLRPKTKDKKPLVKYFKESRPLVDLADIVILIYRDDYYNDDSEDKDILELTIVRNADGERGKIQLVALDKYCKFVDMIKKS